MADDTGSVPKCRHPVQHMDVPLHGALPLLVIPAKAGIQFDFQTLAGARWITRRILRLALRAACGVLFRHPASTVPASAEMTRTGMIERHPCVYILASSERGTLYTGVTSDLIKRTREHKTGVVEGFTKKYRVHDLVWFEQHDTMESAILREKVLKQWKRAWKIELIETINPLWRDLYPSVS